MTLFAQVTGKRPFLGGQTITNGTSAIQQVPISASRRLGTGWPMSLAGRVPYCSVLRTYFTKHLFVQPNKFKKSEEMRACYYCPQPLRSSTHTCCQKHSRAEGDSRQTDIALQYTYCTVVQQLKQQGGGGRRLEDTLDVSVLTNTDPYSTVRRC